MRYDCVQCCEDTELCYINQIYYYFYFFFFFIIISKCTDHATSVVLGLLKIFLYRWVFFICMSEGLLWKEIYNWLFWIHFKFMWIFVLMLVHWTVHPLFQKQWQFLTNSLAFLTCCDYIHLVLLFPTFSSLTLAQGCRFRVKENLFGLFFFFFQQFSTDHDVGMVLKLSLSLSLSLCM